MKKANRPDPRRGRPRMANRPEIRDDRPKGVLFSTEGSTGWTWLVMPADDYWHTLNEIVRRISIYPGPHGPHWRR
jgi:hypothetical protein